MNNFDKVIYNNHFKVANMVFAFKKKELFNITNLPIYIPLQNNSGSKGYWINRQWYSLKKIKGIIINESIEIDLSSLQWYEQIKLIEVFNLN